MFLVFLNSNKGDDLQTNEVLCVFSNLGLIIPSLGCAMTFYVLMHLSESALFDCSALTNTLHYHNDDSVLFSTTSYCPILSQSSVLMPSPPLLSCLSFHCPVLYHLVLSSSILRLLCHPLSTPLLFPDRSCSCSYSLSQCADTTSHRTPLKILIQSVSKYCQHGYYE